MLAAPPRGRGDDSFLHERSRDDGFDRCEQRHPAYHFRVNCCQVFHFLLPIIYLF